VSNQILTAGLGSLTVTSGAAVDLLSSSTSGIPVAHVRSWSLVVKTTQDVTVKFYKAAGTNAGLVLVKTSTATSSAPLVEEMIGESAQTLRVTAIASSTTATVNADFSGRA
jgi:hypothetical protein